MVILISSSWMLALPTEALSPTLHSFSDGAAKVGCPVLLLPEFNNYHF
jgi:hypothetical protein